MRSEGGAGAVLALAIVGAVAIVLVGMLGIGSALVVRQRVVGAADAAALAAADAASGAVPGIPCALADEVAHANGAALIACRIDGLVASVTVSASAGALPVGARARAGPPPWPVSG
jgi:secretion/DNA translocation related TadE-like protein